MENIYISSHTELLMRIMHLKQEKFRQEEEIKYFIKEMSYSLNPFTAAKKYLHKLADNSEVKYDFAKLGLNFGVNLIIGRILGKNSRFKGILSALVVERVSSTLINNNLSKIISGITNFFKRKHEQELNQEYETSPKR